MAQKAETGTDRFSMAEMMAVEMARNLAVDDGTFGGVGAGASIPIAAVRLAIMTVAPNLWWSCGGSAAINPKFSALPLTAQDPRAFVGAEARIPMQRAVDLFLRGSWAWGFNGGMQVDRFGNCNMIGIGPYDNLKVRGPGSVGTLWTATMRKYYLFVWHHNPRVIVEKVDFVCSPGFLDGGDARSRVCKPTASGPALLYTPICVMDFAETTHALRLRSVNPGYTVEDVIKQSGCEIIIPDNVPQTKLPTEHELYLLRTQIDPEGLLRDYRLTVG